MRRMFNQTQIQFRPVVLKLRCKLKMLYTPGLVLSLLLVEAPWMSLGFSSCSRRIPVYWRPLPRLSFCNIDLYKKRVWKSCDKPFWNIKIWNIRKMYSTYFVRVKTFCCISSFVFQVKKWLLMCLGIDVCNYFFTSEFRFNVQSPLFFCARYRAFVFFAFLKRIITSLPFN